MHKYQNEVITVTVHSHMLCLIVKTETIHTIKNKNEHFYKFKNKQTNMEHKKIKLSVLLLGLGITAQAQQVTTAIGGDASGSGGTAAYSVGQVVYTTNTGTTGSVAQGVQQAYEIFTLGINETDLDISLTVFPNPTTDNLTLQISEYNNQKLSYKLIDMQGKLLTNGEVIATQTQVNTSNLPSSIYFINVVNQQNKTIQSFKIIKN